VANHRDDPTRYYHPSTEEADFLAGALAAYRECFDPGALRAAPGGNSFKPYTGAGVAGGSRSSAAAPPLPCR
jgi:hypothetical protein